MIGVLITGHGEFSKGMHHATEMIVGTQSNYKKVIFKENMSLKDYENKLQSNINELLDDNDGIIIFTDLKGGTPFNISTVLSNNYENIEVISGTNLPILVEASIQSQVVESPKKLAQILIETGKNGIEIADLSLNNSQNTTVKDGI